MSATSRLPGSPDGSSRPAWIRAANSIRPTERSVPAMTKRPARNSMSATAASSTCAAILPAGLDNLVGGADDRIAANNHRFGAPGAAARDQFVAVALNEADALEWDAKPRRQHLGEWRPVPLPVIQGAGDDRHSAVRLEADAAHLAAGRPGQFEIIADAAPAQFAAGSALLFSRGKPVPVGQGHCLVQ